MKRRDFIKFSTAAVITASKTTPLYASNTCDLAAIANGEPDKMFDKGIKAFGGMEKFISKGQTVLVKPNIAFAKPPERAANTNPLLVKRIIEHCLKAGAKKVYVMDHTLFKNSYSVSGIESAVKEAGGQIVDAENEMDYQLVSIPKGKRLSETKVHETLMESDVFINVPILKNHMSTGLTCGLKNLMGVVWDRRFYHRNDLDQCIADFPLYRKPDLTVIDAYRTMMTNGPFGNRSQIQLSKMQIISPDPVAADAAAVAQAIQLGVADADKVEYVKKAAKHGYGRTDLANMNISRIEI